MGVMKSIAVILAIAHFCCVNSNPMPQETQGSCEVRRANLLNFMNQFTATHGEISNQDGKSCIYDEAVEWCFRFCGIDTIENDEAYSKVKDVIHNYSFGDICRPPGDYQLYEEVHEAEDTDYNIK